MWLIKNYIEKKCSILDSLFAEYRMCMRKGNSQNSNTLFYVLIAKTFSQRSFKTNNSELNFSK